MTITTFDDAWYAAILERFSTYGEEGESDESHAIRTLGRNVLESSCILAQAIDNLAKTIERNGLSA